MQERAGIPTGAGVDLQHGHEVATRVADNVRRVMVGADDAVQAVVLALLAQGHVLIEGPPGVGKTVLAKSLARSIDGTFSRVQCTADLLPADITGTNIFDPRDHEFHFRQGPIFAHIVLVDEINRSPPRTQSAFLESLDEHQVTVDGATHQVPSPFMVVATLNPAQHIGTFPLPETELDRFIATARLQHPTEAHEAEIAARQLVVHPIEEINAAATVDDVRQAQAAVRRLFIDPKVISYVAGLVGQARRHPAVSLGPSTRATMAIIHLARAHALLYGRDFATPDDVQAVAPAALSHRIGPLVGDRNSHGPIEVVEEIMRQVPVA